MTLLTPQLVVDLRRQVRSGVRIADAARAAGVKAPTVRSAVRGITWSSVSAEPPVTIDEYRRTVRAAPCVNCGSTKTRIRRQRCSRCYTYRLRHGSERPCPDCLTTKPPALPDGSARRVLTAPAVRQARRLHYDDGHTVATIARWLNVKYGTLRRALLWETWPDAGGPGDPLLLTKDDRRRPCECGVLTTHHSGRCRYCRPYRNV